MENNTHAYASETTTPINATAERERLKAQLRREIEEEAYQSRQKADDERYMRERALQEQAEATYAHQVDRAKRAVKRGAVAGGIAALAVGTAVMIFDVYRKR